MSNILKVTTPLTGYENNTIRPNQPTQEDITGVQAPIVPDKVVRPDGRNDAGADAQAQMKQNFESNFSNFIKLLRDSPDGVEDLAQLFREKMASFAKNGFASDGAGVLADFFNRIGLKASDMSGYVQEQVEVSMRFKGPFFDLIRQVFQNTTSVELKSGILDFLRRYADMASGNHILQTIENALKECQGRMFSGPAGELGKLVEQLQEMNGQKGTDAAQGQEAGQNGQAAEKAPKEGDVRGQGVAGEVSQNGAASKEEGAGLLGTRQQEADGREENAWGQRLISKGETAQNAAFLKDRVLPYLNRYITATHDRGSLRNLTVQMAYQISRYENGSMEGIKNVFQRLLGYQEFRNAFGELTPDALETVLRKAADDGAREDIGKGILHMIQSGLKGEEGVERRQVAQNFINSALLNESVYMPVLHLMLPMVVDDRLIYSEMWVDPDAQDAKSLEEDERAVKMLVKFDIEDVGFFDLFFLYRDGRMDLQLDYPDEYRERDSEIRQGISRILSENNIRVENFVTGSSRESIPLTEAFPKLVERRNAVNVRV